MQPPALRRRPLERLDAHGGHGPRPADCTDRPAPAPLECRRSAADHTQRREPRRRRTGTAQRAAERISGHAVKSMHDWLTSWPRSTGPCGSIAWPCPWEPTVTAAKA